uniref:hypothetical protein n=1 Tax=Xanthomonas oryzae TaxID=347 RepID=UPI003DA014DE
MSAPRQNAPRQKVLKAQRFNNLLWSNTWVCTLACGHKQSAYGRIYQIDPIRLFGPPATVGCKKCQKELAKLQRQGKPAGTDGAGA